MVFNGIQLFAPAVALQGGKTAVVQIYEIRKQSIKLIHSARILSTLQRYNWYRVNFNIIDTDLNISYWAIQMIKVWQKYNVSLLSPRTHT